MRTADLIWHGVVPAHGMAVGLSPDRGVWVKDYTPGQPIQWRPAKARTGLDAQVGPEITLAEFATSCIDAGTIPNLDFPPFNVLARWMLGHAPCMDLHGNLCMNDDPASWLVVLGLTARRSK